MKKTLIIIIFIISLFAILPLVGNKFAQKLLNEKIIKLNSVGIEINEKVDSSYLTTINHYEFILSDTEKFLQYLSQYANKQLPLYVKSLSNGVKIGVDLEYSNFPFTKAVKIDIYPLSLSREITLSLKKNSPVFFNQLQDFFDSKGILYHLNYNLLNNDFDGYIKNINKDFFLSNSIKISLLLKDALFHGNGDLIAPTTFTSSVKSTSIAIKDSLNNNLVKINNMSTNSNFESHSTYLNSINIGSITIIHEDNNDLFKLNVFNSNTNISSNIQDKKAELYFKNSFKDLLITTKTEEYEFLDFNSDFSLSNIDKKSLENIRLIVVNMKNYNRIYFEEKIQKEFISLFSKGLLFNIADFSVKEIYTTNNNIGSFCVKSSFELESDKNFAKKLEYAPIFLLEDINTAVKIKLSKKLFNLLLESKPILKIIQNYGLIEGDALVYEVIFRRGEFRINGKALPF